MCISFLLHLGDVVFPKSTNEKRIKENWSATKLQLSQDEIERLKSVDKNYRLFKFEWCLKSTDTVESFWDIAEDDALSNA